MQRQSVCYRRPVEKGTTKASLCASPDVCQPVIKRRRLAHYAANRAERVKVTHGPTQSGLFSASPLQPQNNKPKINSGTRYKDRGAPGEQWRGQRNTFASLSTALHGRTQNVATLRDTCQAVETPEATCTTQNSPTTLQGLTGERCNFSVSGQTHQLLDLLMTYLSHSASANVSAKRSIPVSGIGTDTMVSSSTRVQITCQHHDSFSCVCTHVTNLLHLPVYCREPGDGHPVLQGHAEERCSNNTSQKNRKKSK